MSELVFNTAEAVMAIDRDQRIVLWNKGAEALFGFKTKEVLGRYCYEVIGGRDETGRPFCDRSCSDIMMMRRRELVPSHNLLVRTKAGQEIWVSVVTIGFPSRRKELSVLIHLFRDIGRQKDVEHFVEQLLSNMAKLSLPQGHDPPSTLSASHPMDLTHREREVLRLLASGTSTQVMAKRLFISPATTRNHIHHLLTKLGVHSRLEAVAFALRNGLL